MKSISNLTGRILLLGLGLLAPLLMLEIGVRLAGLAPPPQPNPAIWTPHPLLGWWHVPNSGGIFHSDYKEFETEVRINARGLRDREIGYDNPEGALRILSLADSFGEALQVNLDETYHKQLETQLTRSLNRPVQVLNAGVGGWGTDQEAIFYVAEGFRYNPQVVLLAFFIRNDAVNNYGPLEIARNGGSQQKQFFSLPAGGELIPPSLEETSGVSADKNPASQLAGSPGDGEIKRQPPLLPLADGLWRHSALYRFIVPYLRNIPSVVQRLGPGGILGGEGVIRAGHPATPVDLFTYQTPANAQFEAAWALTEAIIGRLRDEVKKRGATLVVVLVAAPEQLYPAEWEQTIAAHPDMQGLSWDLEAPNRRLASFLAQQNILYLDLLPIFRQAAAQPGGQPLHLRHDQHWTAAGHRLAAQAIHDFLMAELGDQLR